MQLRNIKKIKKNINTELEDRVNKQKKNYYLELKSYNINYLENEKYIKGNPSLEIEDIYNIENRSKMLFTNIEEKYIKVLNTYIKEISSKLSNGKEGIVIRNKAGQPLRPMVLCGRAEVLNLAEDSNLLNVVIL